jgi:hypothetical protein
VSALSRRAILRLAGIGALCLARPGFAEESRLNRLILQAQSFAFVGERMGFISRALLGSPYIGHTLIGGPAEPERFVLREDGFDCVTFCETVLAAARARTPDEFADELRRIRYRSGEVEWFARNHYFAEWGLNNIANGMLRPVLLPGATLRHKTVDYMPALGVRRLAFAAVPGASLIAHGDRLLTGDIVGFLSRRPGLDCFHTGLIVLADDGALSLRHASRSRGRVLDQPLAEFLAENGVRNVALWRPQEAAALDVIV